MNKKEILNLPSIPAASPNYPRGPYLSSTANISSSSMSRSGGDPRGGARPMEPVAENQVYYEWIRMPDLPPASAIIPSPASSSLHLQGRTRLRLQMYLDDDPPIVAGPRNLGFQRNGRIQLEVATDALTGTLHYSGQLVAMGTMAYKHESLARDPAKTMSALTKTQINLKVIPDVDGRAGDRSTVRYALTDITVKGPGPAPHGCISSACQRAGGRFADPPDRR